MYTGAFDIICVVNLEKLCFVISLLFSDLLVLPCDFTSNNIWAQCLLLEQILLLLRAISVLDSWPPAYFFVTWAFWSLVFEAELFPESWVVVLTFGFCESSAEHRNYVWHRRLNKMGDALHYVLFFSLTHILSLQPHPGMRMRRNETVQLDQQGLGNRIRGKDASYL